MRGQRLAVQRCEGHLAFDGTQRLGKRHARHVRSQQSRAVVSGGHHHMRGAGQHPAIGILCLPMLGRCAACAALVELNLFQPGHRALPVRGEQAGGLSLCQPGLYQRRRAHHGGGQSRHGGKVRWGGSSRFVNSAAHL